MPSKINSIDQLEIDFAKLDELIKPRKIESGEPISVRISKSNDQPVDHHGNLVSISPIGALLTIEGPTEIRVGDEIETTIALANQSIKSNYLVTSTTGDFDDATGLVLRAVLPAPRESTNEERRNTTRWSCDERFYPTAMAANPSAYNDYIYLSFRDLSKRGARAITSLRNKFIVQGMSLNCTISLPMITQFSVQASVVNASLHSENGKDYIALGLEFKDISPSQEAAIAQYVIQFAHDATLADLKSDGLVPDSISKAVTYTFARTAEELREVSLLRAETYSHAGKHYQPELSDEYDGRARVIIGYYKGKIIASCRVFFPQANEMFEQEEYAVIPASLGRKDQIAEVMRVCTHPDFRRSDLLLSLFKFIAITCIQAGRPIILGCAEPHLLKIYTSIGFEDTGIEYIHEGLANTKHKVISGDAREGVQGRGVNPLIWNVIWKDTEKYLSQGQVLRTTPQATIRLSLYKLLSPLGKLMQSRMNKPRRKKM